MKFGKYLKENVHAPWREHYIDYAMLKKLVYRTECVQDADPVLVNDVFKDASIDREVREFMQKLHNEIERVGAFYAQKAAELRASLSQLEAEQKSVGASDVLVEGLREVGRSVVLLVQFLELNLTGLRKILKKHEKRIKGHPVAERFLKARQDKESALQMLHNHAELDEIYEAVREDINVARADLQVQALLTRENATQAQAHPGTEMLASQSSFSSFDNVTFSRCSEESGSQARLQDSDGGLHAPLPTTPRRPSSIYVHEPIIREMRDRLRELDNASKFVNNFMITLAEESGITSEEGQGMFKSHSVLALWINIFSTFVFMINYYIVLPTSGAYCQELGAPSSFSGVVVGVLPFAACIAAVGYSYATQYSYRLPLMTSGILCSFGNVLYSLALPTRSLRLILAGRVLVGMGGARVVNRRYIADHVDLDYRTEASAAFVAFTALGMAVGPGLASVTSLVPDFAVLGMPINAITLPGFLMVLIWVPFTLVVLFFFVEPPRFGETDLPAIVSPPSKREGRRSSAAAPLLDAAERAAGDRHSVDRQSGADRHHEAHHGPKPGILTRSNTRFGDSTAMPLLTIEEPVSLVSTQQLMTVGALLWIYLVDKLVCEAWLTSVPIVTFSLFRWGEKQVGLFLCIVCAAVLPAAQVCRVIFAKVQAFTRERVIVSTMLWMVLLGGLALLCYAPPFTFTYMAAYVTGAAVFFLSNNLLEAATMSLLSKKMPKAWAAGVLNSGFLTTLTGLGGRVLGNLIVTLMGEFVTADILNDSLMVPLYVAWGFTMVLFYLMYSRFST